MLELVHAHDKILKQPTVSFDFETTDRDPKQLAEDLANKMQTFLQLSHDDRKLMGKRSREKVEREFDEKFVIDKYRQTIKDILQNHH